MDIARLRFLVVEDHSFQRWMMGNLLEVLGAGSVALAGDGKAAMERLTAPEPIDIVLTDLDMPTMDGMELIRHMSRMAHPASLIVVSSKERALLASVEEMARAYHVRMLGTIQKPLTASKLAGLVALHGTGIDDPESPSSLTFSAEEILAALQAGQIEAFFQPKVQVIDRQVRGAEALVRWRHPRHGLLSPDAFIGAVETAGLMDLLTEKVVREAAANAASWRDSAEDLSVSVNLSPSSLSDPSFADRMIRLVEEAGLEPRLMILELTESAMTDLGSNLENLARLRMKGFGLSIDDYGTGHSSMERLTRAPFTEIKIDRMFVASAASNATSCALVESSVDLARKLGLATVAEGVEDHATWELLLSLNCETAQGYLISRPLAAHEFRKWLQSARRASA